MPSKKILTPIIPGHTYHVFNRGVNYEDVFILQLDYQLFLEKFKFYVSPVADVYAYSLMPNHYHLFCGCMMKLRKKILAINLNGLS